MRGGCRAKGATACAAQALRNGAMVQAGKERVPGPARPPIVKAVVKRRAAAAATWGPAAPAAAAIPVAAVKAATATARAAAGAGREGTHSRLECNDWGRRELSGRVSLERRQCLNPCAPQAISHGRS